MEGDDFASGVNCKCFCLGPSVQPADATMTRIQAKNFLFCAPAVILQSHQHLSMNIYLDLSADRFLCVTGLSLHATKRHSNIDTAVDERTVNGVSFHVEDEFFFLR